MPSQDHHSLLKAALDIEHVPISPLKCLLKFHRKVTLKKFLLSFISTKTLAYEDSGTASSETNVLSNQTKQSLAHGNIGNVTAYSKLFPHLANP
jgi:hypothetical protein